MTGARRTPWAARTGGGDRSRQARGRYGEDRAAAWYRAQGYEVLARNWRSRAGELDLVARRGDVLVVCEVKARASVAYGLPAEAVTPAKQARLRRLAGEWLRTAVSAGDPAGGDTAGGDTAGGDTAGGDTANGDPAGPVSLGRWRPSVVRFDVACLVGTRLEVIEAAF